MRGDFKLKARDYIDEPGGKLTYNRALFSSIADEYARMSHVLSLGQDRGWKRRLINRLPDMPSPRCLDLACGNGDLTALLLERYPDARITGLDLTAPMLAIARARFSGDARISLIEADMTESGLGDAAYDLVTVGYGLRNAPDLDRALAEIARLLKPGGVLATLDFSRWNHADCVERALLRVWCGMWGWICSGNTDTYGYIAASLAHYPKRRDLHMRFHTHGLTTRETHLHLAGVIEARVAVKGA